MGLFQRAHNFTVSQSHFVDQSNHTTGPSGIDILLESSAAEAAYDSDSRRNVSPSLSKTHQQHIKDITDWAALSSHHIAALPIFRIQGPAGAGKSTIAHSCAERLDDTGSLGASFFFMSSICENHTCFFPTIAYQLSIKLPDYRKVLDKKIKVDPTLVKKQLRYQFRDLITRPFIELQEAGERVGTYTILVDGLNECKDRNAQQEIVEVIAKGTSSPSTPLRWAIFSRPEPQIETAFAASIITAICRSVSLPVPRELSGGLALHYHDNFPPPAPSTNPTSSYPSWQRHPHNVPPPFQSAPPMPNSVNVSRNRWNRGVWIPNPHYNPQTSRPNVNVSQWMPGQGWGISQATKAYPPYQPQPQPQQQRQSFNPYKRQPKPPSAEYLATKLSDNPLGLTNMVPAEEIERQERERQLQEEAQRTQTTPWLWAPCLLDDEDDEDHPLTPATPEPFVSKATLQPTFSSSIIRIPPHYRSPSYTSQKRPVDRRSSVENLISEIGPLSTGSNYPPPLVRHSSMPTIHPNQASSVASEPSPIELLSSLAGVLPPPKSSPHYHQPTFSPNIIRTPQHYGSPSSAQLYASQKHPLDRKSSVENLASGIGRPSTGSNYPPPLVRHNSMPTIHANQAPSITSEPSPIELLSSLVLPPPKSSPSHYHQPTSSSNIIRNPQPYTSPSYAFQERPLDRGSSVENLISDTGTLSTGFDYPDPVERPRSLPSNRPSRASSITSESSPKEFLSSVAEVFSPPKLGSSHSLQPTFSSNIIRTPQHYGSPSSVQLHASQKRPLDRGSSVGNARTTLPRRKGFWNRRGDHVTAVGYIVYAPPDQVYPPDLDSYPDGKDEGYMNEEGLVTAWYKRPAYLPPGGYKSIIEYA